MLLLRPHHGMCLFFFEGKGYSKEFIDNMTYIQGELEKGSHIQLTLSGDVLCAFCPNLENNICNSKEKVLRYDQSVLDLLSLSENDILSFKDFSARISEEILRRNLREKICGDCQWNSICSAKNCV